MLTQYKRSWVLLTSFAGCAGLAATPAFAVEPHALMQLVQAGDTPCIGDCERQRGCATDASVRVSFVARNADAQPSDRIQTSYLIKLLERSPQFRVRAQAAISLGMMESCVAVRGALTAALRDAHPAVRAAAATSLGRIGDANQVIALRTLESDPEEPVRKAARASIGRIEAIDELPAARDTAVTTAALTGSPALHARR